MAKKNESTKDAVVRLYKEGYDMERIAKQMGMTKNVVRSLLEKYMPDYESYVQPEIEPEPLPGEKKSKFALPVTEIFSKKHKKDKEAENVAAKAATLNLNVDQYGEFVDHTIDAIAKMIKRGQPTKEIADFFNRDIDEVKAVENCLLEMEKNKKTARTEKKTDDEEEIFNPFTIGKAKRDSNLSKHNSDNEVVDISNDPVETITSAPDPLGDDDGEMPGLSTDNLNIDEMVAVAEPQAAPVEEIPSAAPIDMQPVAVEEAVEAPAEEKVANSNVGVTINKFVPEEEPVEEKTEEPAPQEEAEDLSDLSPMEKMRMFAMQQISQNNAKIEDLNAKKTEAAAKAEKIGENLAEAKTQSSAAKDELTACTTKLNGTDAEVAEIANKIQESDAQIKQLEAQLAELKAKQEELKAKETELTTGKDTLKERIHELESSETEFAARESALEEEKTAADAAVEEIAASIAEIEKENAEFSIYTK